MKRSQKYVLQAFAFLGLLALLLDGNAMKVSVGETKEAAGQIKQQRVFLAFDVETSGSSFEKNGMLSLGAAVFDEEATELASFQQNIQLSEGKEFETECWKGFWSKNPQAYKFVCKNAISPEDAMKKFVDFLHKVESAHPDAQLISDNPTFDIAWINHYLAAYTTRQPLDYKASGQYRTVCDTASVQKIWLCIKEGHTSLVPPEHHRERLGLESDVPHDHNPLNDARRISHNYIQTLKQIREFIEKNNEKMKRGSRASTAPKPIKIEEYNPVWIERFQKQKEDIVRAFKDRKISVDVHHIGSTSVPGLAAKPILDMIAVVSSANMADIFDILPTAGFKYKGEYNLPGRYLFGKKDPYEVYLHLHEEGSPEIELNLKFRNALKMDADLRDEYSQLKKKLAAGDKTASKKVGTGITRYNLGKNDFIKKVLDGTNFKGWCVRFCTQDEEWSAFKIIKNNEQDAVPSPKRCRSAPGRIEENTDTQKNFVMYEGTKITAAARVELLHDIASIDFIGTLEAAAKQRRLSYILGVIEKWLAHNDVSLLSTTARDDAHANLYKSLGFEEYGNGSAARRFMKSLPAGGK